ncbi:MAG TPA: cellulase family glycosylhydrolase [Solirubrobacteraceae bacterium]|nr:cellulase family glycosylhydrolase [Solirubrobacteraceae bacterium]
MLALAAVCVTALACAGAPAATAGTTPGPRSAASAAATAAAASPATVRGRVLARCLRRARTVRGPRGRARARRACLRRYRRSVALARRLFGVSVGGGFQNQDPVTLARDLDAMRAMGARWLRLDINWAQIQDRGPDVYDWTIIDRVVQGATARGMRVLGTLNYTPTWARPPGTAPGHPPPPGPFAQFAATAVRHYAALGVHAYEVWNEPNLAPYWTPRANPAAYAEVLKAAYPAIKAADPSATVVSGGMAPAGTAGNDLSPVDFLAGLYAAGAGRAFDAVGHHPYTWPAYPGDPELWSPWYQMYGTRPNLRSVMAANGDRAKRIWATEYGAPTNGVDGSRVTEPEQAAMLRKAYRLFARYEWGGPLFWYAHRDLGAPGSPSRESFFGLLRHDFSPKESYAAFRAAASS